MKLHYYSASDGPQYMLGCGFPLHSAEQNFCSYFKQPGGVKILLVFSKVRRSFFSPNLLVLPLNCFSGSEKVKYSHTVN